jgi:hypothetical protein
MENNKSEGGLPTSPAARICLGYYYAVGIEPEMIFDCVLYSPLKDK